MHAYNKMNVKHNTDILLKKISNSHKNNNSYDLLLLLVLLFTTIILVICNCIHEIKHISEVYGVTAIL